ncbi:MAG: pectin esterase [Opitutae bacterium]|nr:pectin esterase [Opitutae bacterium]
MASDRGIKPFLQFWGSSPLLRVLAVLGVTLSFASLRVSAAAAADAVVAQDGSGQFKTVQEAVNAAPQTVDPARRWVILIKPGTYREVVYVQREKRFLLLRGEDAAKTTITYDLHANRLGPDGLKLGTFRTPTVQIDADDFSAEDLTFENSAGDQGQALALRLDGDRATFRRCRLLGWQDTLLGNRGRHYFADCYITGATDFIFGGATEYFERCQIHCLKSSYITAASTPENQPYGFVFAHCRITGAPADIRVYLGRPWRDFASVVFLHTEMAELVRPEGWHNWDKPARERTVRYTEFGSTGPGAKSAARVPWSRQLTAAEAAALTPAAVLGGVDNWNPLAASAAPSATASK